MAAVLIVATFGVTSAGVKYGLPVEVGATYAYGSMGSARSSSDTQQYIGCTLSTSGTTTYGTCSARGRNSSGVYQYANCQTTNAAHLDVIRTTNAISALELTWDADTGTCRHISVTNYSYNAPMVP
ncbi:MAG TPA: hypothetical protein VIU61_28900 [Kofleriaceae bacterium]